MKFPEITANSGAEILIVEDSPTQAEQLRHLLEQCGYNITVAANGKEALAVLPKRKPALIVSDIVMPEMDGYELCRHVKTDDNFKNIPFVILTSLSDPRDIIRGLQCGAESFITKPYDESYLASHIQHMILNKSLQETEKTEMGVEVLFAGEKYFITSGRLQIINLLLSTYEAAVQKNLELIKTQDELRELNQHLEEKVRERTKRVEHLNNVILAVRNVNQLIAREKNRDQLLKDACKVLVEGRGGYYNAWIALLEETGKLVTTAEAGLDEKFLPMRERLARGEWPDCMRQALLQSEVLVINDPALTCADCLLAADYSGRGSLVVRLEHAQKVYGVFILSVPAAFTMDKEEQMLIKEVAEDIAFALHSIKLAAEHQRAEEELGQSERKYRTLFEDSLDAIAIISREGRFLDINRSFLDLFGYTREEIRDINIKDTFVAQDDLCRLQQKLEQNESIRDFEAKLRKKDRAELDCLLTVSTKMADNGSILGYQSIIRDITDQKKLEQQFIHSQKMESIGRLAGGVAHDFNNLLTPIIAYTELVLMGLEPDSPWRDNVEEIKKAGLQAESLVRQLLTFSRKQIRAPQVLNLNTIVADINKMLQRVIGENIELETICQPDLGQVEVDPGQVEQIIMNLVVNARDAMPAGGKLTIETANVDLDEEYGRRRGVAMQPGPYVMLGVSDTGMGMDEKLRAQIFEPFFTTKEQGKGTGLGLATVYGIVKQSSGYIWVYSEPGQGSSFKIYLPRVEGEVESVQKKYISEELPRGFETILVVEDNGMVLDLAREVLQRYGYRVLEAQDGEEALVIASQHEGLIHLLLTDVVMPGMSGRELAEQVRARRREMKVLYMSGYADNAVIHHGILDKELNFLQKPFSMKTLLQRVRDALNGE